MTEIEQEKETLTRILTGLEQRGWEAKSVDIGETENISVTSVQEAVEAVFEVDMSNILLKDANGNWGRILCVLGNSPEELVADYTVNHGLDKAMDEIYAEIFPEEEMVDDDLYLSPDQLDDKYNWDGDGEHPKIPRSAWREAVAQNDTISGYWEWVSHKLKEGV